MQTFLHHGIFGFDELRLGPLRINQFPGIATALTAAGFPTLQTRVHPTASIARRAEQLKESILRQTAPGAPILLMAHSLGGLDARHMITQLGMAGRIAALITIATPHRGASLAEFWLRNLGQRIPAYRLVAALGIDITAAHELTRENIAAFNAQTPNSPHTRYFSVSCVTDRPRFRLRLTQRYIMSAEGPNDGIVSEASARWGTHLGAWEMDHVDSVNRGPVDVTQKYVDLARQASAALDVAALK